MNQLTVLAAVAALVMLFVLAEVMAAVLPLIIVLTLVPPGERRELAELLAACDSSRRLRVWPALRTAVQARRRARGRGPGPYRPTEGPFEQARAWGPLINSPRPYGHGADRFPGTAQPSDYDSGSSADR
jgi:hypothetical protein